MQAERPIPVIAESQRCRPFHHSIRGACGDVGVPDICFQINDRSGAAPILASRDNCLSSTFTLPCEGRHITAAGVCATLRQRHIMACSDLERCALRRSRDVDLIVLMSRADETSSIIIALFLEPQHLHQSSPGAYYLMRLQSRNIPRRTEKAQLFPRTDMNAQNLSTEI